MCILYTSSFTFHDESPLTVHSESPLNLSSSGSEGIVNKQWGASKVKFHISAYKEHHAGLNNFKSSRKNQRGRRFARLLLNIAKRLALKPLGLKLQ